MDLSSWQVLAIVVVIAAIIVFVLYKKGKFDGVKANIDAKLAEAKKQAEHMSAEIESKVKIPPIIKPVTPAPTPTPVVVSTPAPVFTTGTSIALLPSYANADMLRAAAAKRGVQGPVVILDNQVVQMGTVGAVHYATTLNGVVVQGNAATVPASTPAPVFTTQTPTASVPPPVATAAPIATAPAASVLDIKTVQEQIVALQQNIAKFQKDIGLNP